MGQREEVGNERIAARLDEFAALLELADAGYYSARAYRRAAERVRAAPVDIAALVRAGRIRELQGIGPGIEARLLELIETGDIAELAELRRSTPLELAAFGRMLGIGAKRAVAIGAALGITTVPEFRAGSGNRAPTRGAGNRRRRRKRGSSRRSSAREARGRPVSCSRALARSPSRLQLRSAESRRETRGVGRTSRSASRSSSARTIRKACASASRPCPRSLRCSIPTPGSRPTGSRSSWSRRPPPSSARLSCARLGHPSTSPRWGRCPRRPTRRPCTAASACRARRPRSAPLASRRAAGARGTARDPRRPACAHDLVGRPRDRARDGRGRAGARLRVPRDLRSHAGRRGRDRPRCRCPPPPGRRDRRCERATGAVQDPAWRRVRHSQRREPRPPGRRARRARVGPALAPSRAARTARGADRTCDRGDAPSCRPMPEPPDGAADRPPPGERPRSRTDDRGGARDGRRARGQWPAQPAGSVRRARTAAVEAGVRIVCSTDAHSVLGLDAMELAVHTARRGRATAADVLNTYSLEVVLAR